MSGGFDPILAAAVSGRPLTPPEMETALAALFEGDVAPEKSAAFLTALRVRGETADELLTAVRFLTSRARMIASPTGTLDTCGTGGDGASTFNISTAVALVVAGAGVPVAKHGNRAVSSASGSSDVLTELGVDIAAPIEAQEALLKEEGIAFLFAPNHHPVLAKVAGVRKALGFRTLFNMLGPLLNPAGAKRQLIGVFDPGLAPLFAEVLKAEGSERAWIVYGHGGLDELSVSGSNLVTELHDGKLRSFAVMPQDAGLEPSPIEALKGGGPKDNAAALSGLLAGVKGAYRDVVVLNAAASLVIAGKAADLRNGARLAAESIDSGQAAQKLAALKKGTAA
ncbi:MAG: anthranilate phosphoribosyltransferase [Pseudomonadota bacterium]